MRSNNQKENQALTPMQKQAVLVCIVCALAALLTIGITLTMLKRGKTSTEQPGDSSMDTPAPAPDGEEDISDHYQINQTSSALLTETADAGNAYQEQTLFIGDSNTVRLYANGLISLQQFCAKEGIGTGAALNEGIVTFKRDDNRYTIVQAVAKMKPRRVVIMLGTNDNSMSTEDFIGNYTALVQAIQASYPYTDIIVNTVPPVPSNHSNYPNMDQTRIDDFNMALLTMCEQLGVKFLNSAEALKDANGYGNVDYYQSGDIHLKPAGLKVLLKYLRAYESEDRRPDTSNIPTRAEYTANPSSAVEAPSSSEAASSSAEEELQYQAGYRVDKSGGGSLICGEESGKSIAVKVTSATQSVTVTAVPEDGYVFVKWSDGVTKRTRTDTNFDQNVDVTAVFAAASIQISTSGKAVLGDSYTFKATLKGKYLDASSIRWYVNGSEVTQAAGKTTVKGEVDPSMLGATFRVYATASYNDCTVTSNKLELTISGAPSSSSTSTGSSGASSGSSGATSASSKEDKPASSKDESSASKEEKPASSKEEKPASSSSNGTSESTGSSSKEEKPASSPASSKEEKPASSSQSSASSKEDKPAASKEEHVASSKEDKPASSKEEKPASSKTEASASKEAAN